MPVDIFFTCHAGFSSSSALTANNGNSGSADGNIDTIGVIDLEATPPREIDQVVVGDGPEGLTVSPTGEIAVTMLLRGSNAAKSAHFYNHEHHPLEMGHHMITGKGQMPTPTKNLWFANTNSILVRRSSRSLRVYWVMGDLLLGWDRLRRVFPGG